jgi:putative ABC transport system permease protein
VNLLATTADGGINGVEAEVVGIFSTPSQAYDAAALRLPLKLARSLVRVTGAQSWVILLQDTEQTDAFLSRFRARYAGSGSDLEFVPWYDRADFYNKTVELFSKQIGVLRVIIAGIIMLTISNILIMGVLERTGEVGTLMAVGFRRAAMLRMFATEGFLLGLAGGVLGILAGLGLAGLISLVGIPMPPPPGMEAAITGRIQAGGAVVAHAFVLVLITTFLAGLYPAWRASCLKVVGALRHNI